MSLTAADIMTRDVVCAHPGDGVAAIARRLSEHAISAVPVCDEQGALVGIVSEGDLMRPFGRRNALRRDWWLNLLADGTELAPAFLDYIRQDRHTARDVMVAPVISAAETTSLSELADLLATHHIKRVPITRAGRLVGIVSRADIVRAMAHVPAAAAI